jgi:hypothetical protein
MVTAELAIAIPALVVLLALVLGVARWGVDRLRCEEAAYVGVRALARGVPEASVRAAVAQRAPAGSVIGIRIAGELVRISVQAPTPSLLSRLPGNYQPTAELTAVREALDDPLPAQ